MIESKAVAINIDQLRFAYKPGQDVLDIPHFSLNAKEHLFLHGPSGSGKTTLLGILTGMLSPLQSGTVQILGHNISRLSPKAKDRFRGDHLGYIFQMFNLIPYLSVLENITLPCRISRVRREKLGGQVPNQAAQTLAEHLNIAHLLKANVVELSVGQQQRVAAARALIGSPEIIIADEPTSALDLDHREAFLKLLFQEADRVGSAILFVSHDHSLKSLFHRSLSLKELNRIGGEV